MVMVSDYLTFLEGCTYCDRCGDRVRPTCLGRVLNFSSARTKRPEAAAGTVAPGLDRHLAGGADHALNRKPGRPWLAPGSSGVALAPAMSATASSSGSAAAAPEAATAA